MIGGIIWPPVEATASTAPAKAGRYPMPFMSGMVNVPVVITLATAEPDTVPNNPLVTTATLAGPPAERPVSATAKSINRLPMPMRSTSEPKIINNTIYVADTATGIP